MGSADHTPEALDTGLACYFYRHQVILATDTGCPRPWFPCGLSLPYSSAPPTPIYSSPHSLRCRPQELRCRPQELRVSLGLKAAMKAVLAGWACASSDHRKSPPTCMVTLSMPTPCWHYCVSSSGIIMAGSFLPGCEAPSSSILNLPDQPPCLLPLS